MSNQERRTDDWGDDSARIICWGIPFAFDALLLAYEHGESRFWITIIAVACLFSGWFAAKIGHGAWESTGNRNYIMMGLLTTGMLTVMFSPLIAMDMRLLAVLPLGILGAFGSELGYSAICQKIGSLKFFGITWCVPGDSSYEELNIGWTAFGIPIAAAFFIEMGII
jgi:hypothetical protein